MNSFKLSMTLALAGVLLSGCYKFTKPPFFQGELVRMEDTAFGRVIRDHVRSMPDSGDTRVLRDDILSNPRVYRVSEEFLILQKQSAVDASWELVVMTRNRHHIMFCLLLEHETVEIPDGAALRRPQGDPRNPALMASGPPEAVKQLALNLSLTAPKACMALPIADPSKPGETL
ncbi:hypothetical protein [Denitrobaculum tricleocarpae]|uniref:Lipoprotein n=1 Tax=Denitrobaculum tricleocarpae TaxID=2591009 RepID=A0A545TTH6_9PROT|nr:hypothetical protein [Denitrobaculum tricleocarpae]TQV80522.1 hypothetical protein FKG95_10110 [Denitrobaculum tricleocarpae]